MSASSVRESREQSEIVSSRDLSRPWYQTFHFWFAKPWFAKPWFSKPNEPKQDLRRVTELLFLLLPAGFDVTFIDCTLCFPPNQIWFGKPNLVSSSNQIWFANQKWFGEPNLVWVQTKSETSDLKQIFSFSEISGSEESRIERNAADKHHIV